MTCEGVHEAYVKTDGEDDAKRLVAYIAPDGACVAQITKRSS